MVCVCVWGGYTPVGKYNEVPRGAGAGWCEGRRGIYTSFLLFVLNITHRVGNRRTSGSGSSGGGGDGADCSARA